MNQQGTRPTRIRSAAAPNPGNSQPRVTATHIVIAGLVAFAVCPNGLCYSNPRRPEEDANVVAAILVALILIALVLWRCFYNRKRHTGSSFLGLLLLPSLWALSLLAERCYIEDFRTIPIWVMGAIALLLIGCGWRAGQLWMPILIAAWVAGALCGPLRAPLSGEFPRSQRIGDLTLEVNSLSPAGRVVFCNFTLRGPDGIPLDSQYDLDNIRMEGSISPLFSFECWQPHDFTHQGGVEMGPHEFSDYTFPPALTRSVDFSFTVPRFPRRPSAELTIPLSPPAATTRSASYSSSGQAPLLSAEDVRWAVSRTIMSGKLCLRLDLVRRQQTDSAGTIFRITTSDGRTIRPDHAGGGGSADSIADYLELDIADQNPRWIKIELFPKTQEEVTFTFRGLPRP